VHPGERRVGRKWTREAGISGLSGGVVRGGCIDRSCVCGGVFYYYYLPFPGCSLCFFFLFLVVGVWGCEKKGCVYYLRGPVSLFEEEEGGGGIGLVMRACK